MFTVKLEVKKYTFTLIPRLEDECVIILRCLGY